MSTNIVHFNRFYRPGRDRAYRVMAEISAEQEKIEKDPSHPLSAVFRKSSAARESRRLRAERRGAWRRAKCSADYWRALADLLLATEVAQREGIPIPRGPVVKPEDYVSAYRKSQEVLLELLLTPAPDAASIIWKRGHLGDHGPENQKKIEDLIAADQAFLKAHPVRMSDRDRSGS